MKTSNEIIEISKAMNLAQREMKPASKDSTNPHFRSKYSDLASVMESIREPIGNNGLSVWQDATLDEIGVNITTRIVHVSGQWVEFGPLTIPIGKRDAHSVGSACSYGKRYALCAALGVVSDDDDDGNKAVASHKNETKQETPTEKKQFIDKAQIKTFNELYEKADLTLRKFIDDTIMSLNIGDLTRMEVSTWGRFMKTFEQNKVKL
jgi:ERF superfamily